MQTDNRLLDDLARMANGALATFSGLREEIETRVRERVERMLTDMDMVPREEFDAVKAIAQRARAEQEELSAKVAQLEVQLAALQTPATKRRKAVATDKATSVRAKSATPARAKGTTPRRRTTKGAAASG